MNTIQVTQNTPYFIMRKHNREPARFLCPHYAMQVTQWLIKYGFIEKHQCIQRLVLGVGRYIAGNRKVAQKITYLGCAHFPWMSLAMKNNESLYPAHVRLLCSYTVMAYPDSPDDFVQER